MTLDNVHKRNVCINVPSSQTFRGYLALSLQSAVLVLFDLAVVATLFQRRLLQRVCNTFYGSKLKYRHFFYIFIYMQLHETMHLSLARLTIVLQLWITEWYTVRTKSESVTKRNRG
jgi:hypothetical protein